MKTPFLLSFALTCAAILLVDAAHAQGVHGTVIAGTGDANRWFGGPGLSVSF